MVRIALCLLMFVWAAALAEARPPHALDRMEAPPTGWNGPVFRPNFDFPKSFKPQPKPWDDISFRAEPERYLQTLLAYALEGQDRANWNVRKNKVRRWYHVPWLGPGAHGREFIHGLTRARDFAPGELGATQQACRQNWALAFYNEDGGAVLGRVWRRVARGGDPDLTALPFTPGTVTVKLVFTEATATDDPKLAGAPELLANIHDACADASRRTPKTLRLIQFDIAVREARASYKTGWVFGSFRYDGTKAGTDPWAKLVPMGLMWGNDPQLSDEAAARGEKPRQSIVFDAGTGFGRGGRMNGIVDERSSACSSCHMAAQWPSVAPMTAPAEWAQAKCWFRNLDARYTFGFPPGVGRGCADTSALAKIWPLDFSLQMTVAVRNWSMERTRRKAVQTQIGTLKRRGDRITANGIEAVALKR